MMQRSIRRSGLTLIELLVVISIVGTLVGLILGAVQSARNSAARIQCQNNLKQIALALHHYHDVNRTFPSGIRLPPDPFAYLGWEARILPYLEGQPLWRRIESDFAVNPIFAKPPAHAAESMVIPFYVCPAESLTRGVIEPEKRTVAFTSYLGVSGRTSLSKDGVFFLNSQITLGEISDGTSSTLMNGERPPSGDSRFGWWYAAGGQNGDGSADMYLGVEDYRYTFRYPTCPFGPYAYKVGKSENHCDTFHFWSHHAGGANFSFCDGSVRLIRYSASPLMLALSTRAGGEAVAVPD